MHHVIPVIWYPIMLPRSCNIAVIKYAGVANGISWQILSCFLNLNSQLESNQPFKIPKPPPNKLVKNIILIVPNISSLAVIPSENSPLRIIVAPSKTKFIIGRVINIAIKHVVRFRKFNS